jgi:hypothetical protein
MSDRLEMFVVYDNPSDNPGKFVVRRWPDCLAPVPMPEATPMIVCDALDVARAAIPPWAVRLERNADDDPAICEVWV